MLNKKKYHYKTQLPDVLCLSRKATARSDVRCSTSPPCQPSKPEVSFGGGQGILRCFVATSCTRLQVALCVIAIRKV
ncbi:hypothetical protein XELAEV_18001917mg [Xenopus laevis]|nr:hypothetical protein XELAEV_18001917mg [Xenopus laevis]